MSFYAIWDNLYSFLVKGFSLLVGGGGRARRPSREGKSPENEVEANPLFVINYHVHNST